MKNLHKLTLYSLPALLLFITPALADDAADIEKQAVEINEATQAPEAQGLAVHTIKEQFEVDDQVINDLRDKDMGYGEITTTLSLAERMEGGINDENIKKITDLRQGANKTGWGNIAKQFDVKMGDLKKDVDAVSREVRPQVLGPSGKKMIDSGSDAVKAAEKGNRPEFTSFNKGPKARPDSAVSRAPKGPKKLK